ncbi:MAG: hypothetical protein J6U92_05255 [Clostridia bacterium]|nr:hypothetical protein [Clostridia bacterium]
MRLSLFKNLLPDSNSQVTLELRKFIEEGQVLFDTDDKYPIWEEEHRAVLEKKIVEHYYHRQIGFETWALFKYNVNVRMREIMPYYVDIWKTTQYDYNPIENYSMEEEFTDNSKGTATSSGKSSERVSDTPQNSIDNLDQFMSSASKSDTEGKSETKTDNLHHGWRKGNIGVTTSQQMIQAERDITLNLDVEIIEKLKDLFLGVY